MNPIIDASVAAKWFNEEEFTEQAVDLKDRQVRAEIELAAPSHLFYEVGNSIWRNPQLSDKDARDAMASLAGLEITLFAPQTERVARTMEIARMRRVSFYDAAYIQTAEECEATLITADEVQLEAAKGIVQAIHLRDTGRDQGSRS